MPSRVLAVALLAQTLGALTPIWTKLALDGPLAVDAGVRAPGARVLVFLLALARVARAVRSARRAPWTRARPRTAAADLVGRASRCRRCCCATGAERSTATAYALLTPLEPIGIVLGGAILLCARGCRARARSRVALGTLGSTRSSCCRTACAPTSAMRSATC